jgi:hypothetical protein
MTKMKIGVIERRLSSRMFRQPCFAQAVREGSDVFRSVNGKPILELGDGPLTFDLRQNDKVRVQ